MRRLQCKPRHRATRAERSLPQLHQQCRFAAPDGCDQQPHTGRDCIWIDSLEKSATSDRACGGYQCRWMQPRGSRRSGGWRTHRQTQQAGFYADAYVILFPLVAAAHPILGTKSRVRTRAHGG